MDRKLQLAKLILLESKMLLEITDVPSSLMLTNELTKDAVELSKLILEDDVFFKTA